MLILEEPIKGVKEVKNFINGEWVDSKGKIVDVVNPATGKVMGKCPISTREEIDAAVEAAKEAFPDWRRTTPLARSRCLFRLKELLEENFEEVSRIQTMEHGKCIDESRGETMPSKVVLPLISIRRITVSRPICQRRPTTPRPSPRP